MCSRASSTAGMTPLPMAPSGILEETGKKPAAWSVSLFLLIDLDEVDDEGLLVFLKGASGDTACQQLRECN